MVDATQVVGPKIGGPQVGDPQLGDPQVGVPSERPRLPIRGIVAGSFRVYATSPLLFLAFGGASELANLARLVFDPPTSAGFDRGQLIALLSSKLLIVLVQTMITQAAVRLGAGEAAPIGDGLRLGLRRYLPMLGLSILILLIIYAGFLLLIVPGFIATVILAVTVPVCALEGAGPVNSIRRSAFLTKGERWRIFGLYCILMVPFVLLVGVGALMLTLRGHLVAAQWVSLAVEVVWIPLATIVSAEIYTQLRRLKENVGVARIFD